MEARVGRGLLGSETGAVCVLLIFWFPPLQIWNVPKLHLLFTANLLFLKQTAPPSSSTSSACLSAVATLIIIHTFFINSQIISSRFFLCSWKLSLWLPAVWRQYELTSAWIRCKSMKMHTAFQSEMLTINMNPPCVYFLWLTKTSLISSISFSMIIVHMIFLTMTIADCISWSWNY